MLLDSYQSIVCSGLLFMLMGGRRVTYLCLSLCLLLLG